MMRDEQTSAPAAPVAAGAAPAAEPTPGSAPAAEPAPAAGLLAVLALIWLLVMLSSARQAIGDSPDHDPLTVTRAALELPQVISASLIAGIAVGLAVVNLLTRLVPASVARVLPRLATGAGAGAVTGLAVATPILLRYDGLPSILVLSGAVAAAATLGGLLTGVRDQAVVAAGTAGALAVFAIGLVERVFEGNLRQLFGAGASAESVITASGWVVLTASLVAGAVAGLLGFTYLRRAGSPGLRWPAYLAAGAMPGLLVLLAEAVTRLAGARLFQLVSAASANDQAVLSYFNAARFNRALIVLFVGALVAIGLLGRTLRPAEPELAGRATEPERAATPAAESEPSESEPAEPEPATPEHAGPEHAGPGLTQPDLTDRGRSGRQ